MRALRVYVKGSAPFLFMRPGKDYGSLPRPLSQLPSAKDISFVLEIEIKARISDPEALKRALEKDFAFLGEKVKKDRYYCEEGKQENCQPETDKIARLRVNKESVCLTVKRKRVEEKVEINEEYEVNVDDFDNAESVLRALGFVPFIEKVKITQLFQDPEGPKLEFNEIKGLGFFLEIEDLLPEKSCSEDIARCKSALKARLESLGLSEQDMEARPYMTLLREQRRERPAS